MIPELSASLWLAICTVESGNNPKAHNVKEDARGIAQIRACVVEDVNRILLERKAGLHYGHNAAWYPVASQVICSIYLDYWASKALENHPNTKDLSVDELKARIWNGGPSGWMKKSTKGYWKKIQEVLKDTNP
jgi:hypothetical protein